MSRLNLDMHDPHAHLAVPSACVTVITRQTVADLQNTQEKEGLKAPITASALRLRSKEHLPLH